MQFLTTTPGLHLLSISCSRYKSLARLILTFPRSVLVQYLLVPNKQIIKPRLHRPCSCRAELQSSCSSALYYILAAASFKLHFSSSSKPNVFTFSSKMYSLGNVRVPDVNTQITSPKHDNKNAVIINHQHCSIKVE